MKIWESLGLHSLPPTINTHLMKWPLSIQPLVYYLNSDSVAPVTFFSKSADLRLLPHLLELFQEDKMGGSFLTPPLHPLQ